MTSSISTSELGITHRAAAEDRLWRRWIVRFCVSSFGVLSVLYILLLLIDPYESNRFPNFGLVGIDDHTPRMAHVSRGQNPRFDSAIFGNSTGQLIDPNRLSQGTGLSFTSLTVPKSGPREELALMEWVLRNHPHIGAWIVVTDHTWCSADPNLPLLYAFPFWLYGSDFSYLANLFNSKSFDRAAYRIQLALGLRQPTDPVGYFDYTEQSKGSNFLDPPPTLDMDASPGAPFPWIDAIGRMLRRMPSDASMILLMPPVYYSMIPQPGTPLAERVDRCKAALARVVANRSRSAFLDFRVDNPAAHDKANFGDGVHYRKELGRQEEDAIMAVLRQPPPARH